MQASAKIRLQLAEQAEIACPGEVFAGQPEKKRGRVDTAVVRRKRQLAGLGQLALTQLVEDLPWLLITPRIELSALPAGKLDKTVACNVRLECQRLESDNRRVTSGESVVPGRSGRRVSRAGNMMIPEHPQIAE